MPRRLRLILPELLQVFNRDVVPGEMQRSIQQRRSVPIRKHKAVAVRPMRILRIVPHVLVKEQIRNRRIAQWPARRAALGLVYGIDCKKTKCINGKLVNLALNVALKKRVGPGVGRFPNSQHALKMLLYYSKIT